MKKLILIFFLGPVFLFSGHEIDNRENRIAGIDTLQQIKMLNELAMKFLYTSPDTSLKFARSSLFLSHTLDNDTLRAHSSYIIGAALIQEELYDEALPYSEYSANIFKKYNNSLSYVFSLSDLSNIYYNMYNYNKAINCFKEIYKIGIEKNNSQWRALALDGFGSIHYAKGEYNKALKYMFDSLDIYKNMMDNNNIIRLLYGIGASFTTIAKYDQAIDYLLKSTQKASINNNREYIASSNHAIGVIYERLKNYHIALKYNFRALQISQEDNDKIIVGSILSHIGKIYFHLSEYDSAWSYLEKSLEVQRETKNKVGIANVLDLLGEIHYRNKNYTKALDSYKKAWQTIINIDEKYRKTKITNHLGIVYTDLGKFDLAYRYLYKANTMAKEIKAQDLIQESLSSMSEYYAAVDNYNKAYHYLIEFADLRDSIFTVSSHHIAEMQMRYETEKREKENELLRNEIEIQRLALDKEQLKIWVSYLSLVIVSIIGFFGYNRYRAKRRINIRLEEKIKRAIQKQKEQQEIIFHQANLTSLGELAAGMAHEINQPLQDIKLCTESLSLGIQELNSDDSGLKNDIAEIYLDIDRIRNIVDHVRMFSSQQKNHINEYFIITPVIENALSLIGKQYFKKGIRINLKLNNRIGQLKGNPYKFEQIVINLLSNAKDALLEKENKGKEIFDKIINIYTSRQDDKIILQIEDNGIGMNSEQKKNIFHPFFTTKKFGEGTGLGLSIVFGIVKDMNGTITVNSEIQNGTMVEVRFPRAMKTRKRKK